MTFYRLASRSLLRRPRFRLTARIAKVRLAGVMLICGLTQSVALAQPDETAPAEQAASTAAVEVVQADVAETASAVPEPAAESVPDLILVVGAAGEAEYGEAFAEWANRWQAAGEGAGARLTLIGNHEPAIAGQADGISPADDGSEAEAASDRQRLEAALSALEPNGEAAVWLVMIGHGTFNQQTARFNLRGPDVAAAELATWVGRIRRPLVVVNAFSSSGPFINALSGDNRVIVTATRSGIEQDYSRFGDYLSRAIADPQADIDHDGEVSILEAFLVASAEVRDFYQAADRLQTEHALIDDNGDGLGTPPTAFRGTRLVARPGSADQQLDGKLAAKTTLVAVAPRLPFTADELAQREQLEGQIERLHADRETLGEDDYQSAVLPPLIALAKLYQKVESRLPPAPQEPDEE